MNLLKNNITFYSAHLDLLSDTYKHYEIVRNEILTRLIKADLLYTSRDGETKGKRITNISQIK